MNLMSRRIAAMPMQVTMRLASSKAKPGKRKTKPLAKSAADLVTRWATVSTLDKTKQAALLEQSMATAPKLESRELGLLAQAVGSADVGCDQPWQDLFLCLEDAASNHLEKASLPPADTTNLAFGLAKARHHAPELLDKLATKVISRRQGAQWKPRERATMLWSYAILGHSAPKLFQSLGGVDVVPLLSEFKTDELAQLMWAFAAADIPNPQLFADPAFPRTLKRLDWQEKSALHQLHQWRLWCDERESAATLPEPLARRCARAFRSTDVAPRSL